MIIEVMSREKILEYSLMSHAETAAVISIANWDMEFPDLSGNANNGIQAQCRLNFNDVELGMSGCITDEDAEKIAAFVGGVAVRNDKLIVQCEYGASRSAGVAAAIMMALSGDDRAIWNNAKYRPNISCYKMVMVAFHAAIDECDLNSKVAKNRRLFGI